MRYSPEKSDEIFKFLQKYMAENGYAPSVREVCRECGIKSTATVFTYLNRLSAQGLIDKTGKKNRALSLKQKVTTIPLIGTVAAGHPIFASENYEDYFSVPNNFFEGDELFMLNVQGDSMINVGIYNGDKLVVKKQDTAENGEIIVALIDDSTTVKRFFKQDGKIILHPENDSMDDMVFDNVTILGLVVGLMRKM